MEGEIAGSKVSLTIEQQSGQPPATVNVTAVLANGSLTLGYQHGQRTLSIATYGSAIGDVPVALVTALLEEVSALYVEKR